MSYGSSAAVKQALCNRIATSRLDMLEKYGITLVMDQIEEHASHYESIQLDEIGTSDVSCWLNDIEESCKRIIARRQATT